MKTFLTDVYKGNEATVIELTLVDSQYKSANIRTVNDIHSVTIVSDEITILDPIVVSDRTVKFVTKEPKGDIEVITVNHLTNTGMVSREIELQA